jgi:hypothetical protein
MTTVPEQATARPGRRTRIVVAVVAALLLLAVAAGGVYVALASTDQARIRGTVTDFAAAVDRQDQPAMLDLLCADEAAAITEDDDYDPSAEPVDAPVLDREVTDVSIAPDGQTAIAVLVTPGREPVSVPLRRERDRWTVC